MQVKIRIENFHRNLLRRHYFKIITLSVNSFKERATEWNSGSMLAVNQQITGIFILSGKLFVNDFANQKNILIQTLLDVLHQVGS